MEKELSQEAIKAFNDAVIKAFNDAVIDELLKECNATEEEREFIKKMDLKNPWDTPLSIEIFRALLEIKTK